MYSTTSILGNIWKLKEVDERESLMLAQRHNLSLIVAKLLNTRNISNDQVDLFLNPEILDMKDETEEDPMELEAGKFNLNYIKMRRVN